MYDWVTPFALTFHSLNHICIQILICQPQWSRGCYSQTHEIHTPIHSRIAGLENMIFSKWSRKTLLDHCKANVLSSEKISILADKDFSYKNETSIKLYGNQISKGWYNRGKYIDPIQDQTSSVPMNVKPVSFGGLLPAQRGQMQKMCTVMCRAEKSNNFSSVGCLGIINQKRQTTTCLEAGFNLTDEDNIWNLCYFIIRLRRRFVVTKISLWVMLS